MYAGKIGVEVEILKDALRKAKTELVERRVDAKSAQVFVEWLYFNTTDSLFTIPSPNVTPVNLMIETIMS